MSSTRAIIKITAIGKSSFLVNYSRRIYAIVRRYTPEGLEGERNECYADITGLRTFYKKTYTELADTIVKDIEREVGVVCSVYSVTVDEYESVKNATTKKSKNISTYKEMNKLFAGAGYVPVENRSRLIVRKKIRLTVPFLGKVK
ncbi:MAG: hypothetical protein KBC21_01365 [Candidatus Pacebacteria bacterium]|jgi:hypothetical protein|nr:hypothetical protein [Candidatus Paceibacterota bacterium]